MRDYNVSLNIRRDPTNTYIGNPLAKWDVGFSGTPNNNIDHTIIEFAVNITMASEYDGYSKPEALNYRLPVGTSNNSIKLMFQVPEYVCNWSYPQEADSGNPSTYANLVFQSESDGPNIPFSSFGIITMITSITIIGITIVIIKRKEI